MTVEIDSAEIYKKRNPWKFIIPAIYRTKTVSISIRCTNSFRNAPAVVNKSDRAYVSSKLK